MGFARVSSTERRRADIKSGHFIARSTRSLTRATRVGLRQSGLGPPAPLDSRHNRADDLRDCENAALDAGLNSQLSLFHTSEAQLSTLTPPPFDPPQRGHPIPETFRDASRGSRCARSAPRRAALSCVPCLSRVRALCSTAPTCCEHPASRVERGMAATRHTLMDKDKIPPSSITDSTHTQLACRKGRVHSSPDLHA